MWGANRIRSVSYTHLDVYKRQVLWDGMEPFLIDWEAAGYVNPERELIEVVNYWADVYKRQPPSSKTGATFFPSKL